MRFATATVLGRAPEEAWGRASLGRPHYSRISSYRLDEGGPTVHPLPFVCFPCVLQSGFLNALVCDYVFTFLFLPPGGQGPGRYR